MRRVLAPLRRCFADDGRRTRLRALYEDAALVRGSDAAVVGETDPTTVIADRKIADAVRRGVFDDLDGQGAPLKAQPHRSAALGRAQRAGAEIAGVLAAQNVSPPSIDLRRRVDEGLADCIRSGGEVLYAGDASIAVPRALEASLRAGLGLL